MDTEEQNVISCHICNYQSDTNDNLKCHLRNVHFQKSPKVSCTDCEIFFKNKDDLLKHIGEVHNNLIKCNKCNFSCYSNDKMKRHITDIHGNFEKFICSECNQVYIKEWTLKRHMNTVHNMIGKSLKFTYIDNHNLSNGSSFKSHFKNVHNQTEELNCSKCNFKANDDKGLVLHIKKHHNENSDYVCNFCGTKFISETNKQNHIMRRTCKVLRKANPKPILFHIPISEIDVRDGEIIEVIDKKAFAKTADVSSNDLNNSQAARHHMQVDSSKIKDQYDIEAIQDFDFGQVVSCMTMDQNGATRKAREPKKDIGQSEEPGEDILTKMDPDQCLQAEIDMALNVCESIAFD